MESYCPYSSKQQSEINFAKNDIVLYIKHVEEGFAQICSH